MWTIWEDLADTGGCEEAKTLLPTSTTAAGEKAVHPKEPTPSGSKSSGVATHAPLSRTVLNTEDDDNDPAEIESAKRAAAAAHTTSETMKTQQADSKTAQKYTRVLDRVFDSRGVPDFLARWTPWQLLSNEVMKDILFSR